MDDKIKKLVDAMYDEAEQRRDEIDPSDDLEWLFEKHYDLQGLDPDKFIEVLESKRITKAFESIGEMLREYHVDKHLFQTDPMKYYGLSQKDFL